MRTFISCVSLALFLASSLEAAPITLQFTNAEVNLGNSSQIPLTNQYAAFGVTFQNVYRYIDSRDPFSDAPNQVGGSNLGIANGLLSGPVGRVDFNAPVSYITFDWWEISDVHVDAFDNMGVLVGSFSSAAPSGTNTINGNISYFEFHNGAGLAPIANLTYDFAAAEVPEPASLLLWGAGAAFVTWRARRRLQ